MRARLLVVALLALVALAAPAGAEAASSSESKVIVGAKINRFAVEGRNIVAHGILTTRVEGAGQSQAARKRVTFAVSAQQGRCHVLTLTLEELQLTLLGLQVDLSEVNLRIYAIRRGEGSGILGRLFCALSRSTVRLGRGAGAAEAQKVVRALNTRLEDRPMRAFRATAVLGTDDNASAAQTAPSCQVLRLVLGPLDLNLLGLVVELYGENRNSPITLTITGFPGQGVLGDLFCSLAGGPQP
jgi:hypothetical protein